MKDKIKFNTKVLLLLCPGLFIFVLDQYSKFLTAANMKPNQVVSVLEQKWFFWTRLPNSGLLFQNFEMVYSPENAIWTRYLPALALIITAKFWVSSELKSDRPFSSSLATIGFSVFWFGGFSNVLSHCLSVFVDDTMSAMLFPGSRFYTFNIADLGITLGMLMFFMATLQNVYKGIFQSAVNA
jgi:lipoprotein signal peptidase